MVSLPNGCFFPSEQLRKHMLFMTAVQAGTHGGPMPGHRPTLLYNNYTVILQQQQMRCVTFLKLTELIYDRIRQNTFILT